MRFTILKTTALAATLFAICGAVHGELSDDFSSGLDDWYLLVYDEVGGSANDPPPAVDTVLGQPAPSLDVNGDSSCGNAAYSRQVFDYTRGMVVEWDMYVASGYDWNWGFGGLSDHLPNLSAPRQDGAYVDNTRCGSDHLAGVRLMDDGMFDQAPSSLTLSIIAEDGSTDQLVDADADDLLNAWHHYMINIREDGYVEFFLDDDLLWTSEKRIDSSRGEIPVSFGDRDHHGPVRVDNVDVRMCSPSSTNLCLNEGRFKVEVNWVDFQANGGTGQVVPLGSDDSGLFWFFDPDNWEMLVKVLDACGLNGRYWVFAAATTNVEYTLRVVDTETDSVVEYHNPLGTASPAITDTSAFATCP